MVHSGTDIIKIAWLRIWLAVLYAGVSPNPSDYVEPLYQGVEKNGNVIPTYFHLILYQWK
jgi:hypothetical protein